MSDTPVVVGPIKQTTIPTLADAVRERDGLDPSKRLVIEVTVNDTTGKPIATVRHVISNLPQVRPDFDARAARNAFAELVTYKRRITREEFELRAEAAGVTPDWTSTSLVWWQEK